MAGSGAALRALVEFDEIPAEAEISEATLSLWRSWPLIDAGATIDVHEVTSEWDEATATWTENRPGVAWATPGGDFDPTPISSLEVPEEGNEDPGWDDYDLTDIVEDWSSAEAQNNGVLLKSADEETAGSWPYYTDDWSVAPTLRPKLTILYADGSQANPPSPVAVTAPAAETILAGTQTISAAATDDSGIASVEFYVDQMLLDTDTSEPYTAEWDTELEENGAYELSVKAIDRAGLSGESAPITVQVGNSAPPTVEVTVSGSTTYEDVVLADQPAGYWRLGEADASSSATDISGNGLGGTYTAAAIDGEQDGATADGDTAYRFTSVGEPVAVDDNDALAFEEDFSLEAFLWTMVAPNQVVAAKDGLWKVEVTDDAGHEGELKISLADPEEEDTYQSYYGPVVREIIGSDYDENDWVTWDGYAWSADTTATNIEPGEGDWTQGGAYLGEWDEGISTAQEGEYWTTNGGTELFMSLVDDNYFLPGSIDGLGSWEEVEPFAGEWVATEGSPAENGDFRHIVVSVEDWAPTLYLNGAAETLTPDETEGETDTVQDFRIGGFLGLIDEVSVYPAALSPLQASTHYEAAQSAGTSYDYASDNDPLVGGEVVATVDLSAVAADDENDVTKVEFLIDGVLLSDDTDAPYEGEWNTLDSENPVWDGAHTVSARAYDDDEHTVTTAEIPVIVINGETTPFRATITPQDPIPSGLLYDPELVTQDSTAIDVQIVNTSGLPWDEDFKAAYRWVKADSEEVVESGAPVSLGSPTGNVYQTTLNVRPPEPPNAAASVVYRLRIDVYDSAGEIWFASMANTPFEQAVAIDLKLPVGLGLERYYPYVGEPVGAGMENIVNVASGNSILRWTPFSSPGRGLSTVTDLTYNSQEGSSSSPLGPGWSLAISSLNRVGSPLDFSTAGIVQLIDGDGTRHRFSVGSNGTLEEPPGVQLFFRQTGSEDPDKFWAATRPDEVTFYFSEDGVATSVEDRNGNEIVFTYNGAGQLIGVTDAAGASNPGAHPERTFKLTYYTVAEAGSAGAFPGRLKEIKDHVGGPDQSGSPLRFLYDASGRLVHVMQVGGVTSGGVSAANKDFKFSYEGTSTRIDKVTDPRNYGQVAPALKQTDFDYTTIADIARLTKRTNRTGDVTDFDYTPAENTTEVQAPEGRDTLYETDENGLLETLTNPKDEVTTLEWSDDFQVEKITNEETERFTEYGYDDNGYLESESDELGNTTELAYDYFKVDDELDVETNWAPGQGHPHLSRLVSVTEPNGVATTGVAGDYQWEFGYEDGNLTSVEDPLGKTSETEYAEDGTIESTTDANDNDVTYPAYDANGFPTQIHAENGTNDADTKAGYDADGLLLWTQDPNHAQYPNARVTDANPNFYRTYFVYDGLQRLALRIEPTSTQFAAGALVYTKTAYDQNGNVRFEYGASQGACCGAETEYVYDAMDRKTDLYAPARLLGGTRHRSIWTYDDAGRLETTQSPRQVTTTLEATVYAYDLLDRIITETRTGDGATDRSTHYCYDEAGDLRFITSAKGETIPSSCEGATPTKPAYTTQFDYDEAHRKTKTIDPKGNDSLIAYDKNGQITETTDERGALTSTTYDQRGQVEKVEQQLTFSVTPEILTTKYLYDDVGNLTRTISPRAYDYGVLENSGVFAHYLTNYQYDQLNRLTRTELPRGPSGVISYIHRGYDPNGNLTWISLPVGDSTPGPVPNGARTKTKYLDTGAVYEVNDPQRPPVRYEYKYNAQGQWETWRTPITTAPVVSRRVISTYFRDGLLQNRSRQGNNLGTFTYDGDGNTVTAGETAGTPTKVETDWNEFGEPAQIRQKLNKVLVHTTGYQYDKNGNLEIRSDDGRESVFVYDQNNQLDNEVDYQATVGGDVKLRKIQLAYFDNGLISGRTLIRRISGDWVTKATTTQAFYANGLLKTLTTVNGASTTLESHVLGYRDTNDVYLNGNRTTDTYELKGPNTGAPCRPGSECEATYGYDGRDRLTSANNGHGDAYTYTLDRVGNVTTKVADTADPTVTTDYYYDDNTTRLKRTDANCESPCQDEERRYWYTSLGDLWCVTNGTVTGISYDCADNDNAHADDRLQLYNWDSLERLSSLRTLDDNDIAGRATYEYDGLDRPVITRECHSEGDCGVSQWWGEGRQTKLYYVGKSGLVAKETATGDEHDTDEKRYSYDPYGGRNALEADNGTPDIYLYTYDAHGSTSLLIQDANSGSAQASYGYDAYGGTDTDLTRELKPGETTVETSANDPLNPYRYTGKRKDTGTGSIDMGARRFNPATARFLSSDYYAGALDDLGLSTDPLTANRYALAGGNPITYVETDGHVPETPQTSPDPEPHAVPGGRTVGQDVGPDVDHNNNHLAPDHTPTGGPSGSPGRQYLGACDASYAYELERSMARLTTCGPGEPMMPCRPMPSCAEETGEPPWHDVAHDPRRRRCGRAGNRRSLGWRRGLGSRVGFRRTHGTCPRPTCSSRRLPKHNGNRARNEYGRESGSGQGGLGLRVLSAGFRCAVSESHGVAAFWPDGV